MRRRANGFYDWLAGFIDGEGCFRVVKQRRGDSVSYQPGFYLGLRDDDEHILRTIQFKLGVGTICRRKAQTKDRPGANPGIMWQIQDFQGCAALVEILDKHPLRSKKQLAYQAWREVVLDKVKANATRGTMSRGQDKELQAEARAKVLRFNQYMGEAEATNA